MANVSEALARVQQLQQAGDFRQAEELCRRVLHRESANVDALCLLGTACRALGKREEAVATFRRAVRLRPESAHAHNGLGTALSDLGRLDEAVASFRQALRLAPAPHAHNNLGVALARQGQLDEAVACYHQALRLNPHDAEAHNHLGMARERQGRLDEALACFEEALRLRPDYADAHSNRAMLWLLRGDLARGWPEYEWRWRSRDRAMRLFPRPVWDGSPLAGRTILLHLQQGLGDTLLFIRYAALVKRRGGRVVVECLPTLVPLFSGCPGVDELIPSGSPLPPFDVHAPLMTLPALFGTTLDTVPADVPYLFADAGLVARWQGELAPLRGFRVGINWAANPENPVERFRTVPLAQFEPLARVPGVRLVSLQKGPGSEQLAAAAGRFEVTDLGPRLDTQGASFVDTAAVMKNLDLVITSDTSVPHLAGALGVPVWLAVPHAPAWRWLLGREDSPWYPTMRLFRQDRPDDWSGPFERMRAALQRLAAGACGRPVLVAVPPGELLDKITILEIKSERLADLDKLANVRRELAVLAAARDRALPASPELARLAAELKAVNEALWQIEDDVRRCERAQDFGPRFVELARSVYRTNDRRAALKRRVNELLGSELIEEKSYASYE